MDLSNVPQEIWFFVIITVSLLIQATLYLVIRDLKDQTDGFISLILEAQSRECCVTCYETAREIVTYRIHSLPLPGEDPPRIILPYHNHNHEYLPGVLVALTTEVEDAVWPPVIEPLVSSAGNRRHRAWRRIP